MYVVYPYIHFIMYTLDSVCIEIFTLYLIYYLDRNIFFINVICFFQ